MVQQDLIDQKGEVGEGEEDVQEAEGGGQDVPPPSDLLVKLVDIPAV